MSSNIEALKARLDPLLQRAGYAPHTASSGPGEVQQLFQQKCYVAPWAIVLPERRAYAHQGLPFAMGAPSAGEIQRLLA